MNKAGLRVNGKLHVVVTARQHPGEANASWIMDGMGVVVSSPYAAFMPVKSYE